MINLRNATLDKISKTDLLTKFVVCSNHFEDDQYVWTALLHDSNTRLKWSAIPAIIDPPNPLAKISIRFKLPVRKK